MYEQMCDILEERELGGYRLEHFEIKSGDWSAILRGIAPGKYVRLTHRGEVIMSDTDMEKRTNAKFVHRTHGKVLVGGLGIGFILLPAQQKSDVEKIVVLERNQEVIDLVKDQLPLNEKVEIIKADVYDYVPAEKFNTIYLDIWNFINTNVYEESMKPLLARYRKYLVSKTEDPDRYIDCWCKHQAKNGIRI